MYYELQRDLFDRLYASSPSSDGEEGHHKPLGASADFSSHPLQRIVAAFPKVRQVYVHPNPDIPASPVRLPDRGA